MAIKTRLLLAMLLIICFSHSLYAKSRKKTDAENGLKQISSATNNLPDKAAGNAPVAESRESLETDENSLQDAEESAEKSAEEKFANNVCETLFSEFNNFIQKVLIENNEKAIQYYLTRSL